jgi:photosystem II stability/assembly factor-like uncharacterized protein
MCSLRASALTSALALALALALAGAAILPTRSDAAGASSVHVSSARATGTGAGTGTGAVAAGGASAGAGDVRVSSIRAFHSSGSLATPLVSTPEVVLETEPKGEYEVLGESVRLKATPVDLPVGVATYVFEQQEAEAEGEGGGSAPWTVLEESTVPVASTSGLSNGLYNFRVRVTVAGKEYESELTDLLATGTSAPPTVKLKQLSTIVRGNLIFEATVPQKPGSPRAQAVKFQYEPTGSPPGPGAWKTIEALAVSQSSGAQTVTSAGFSTTTLPDGRYSFRVVPEYPAEEGEGPPVTYATIPERGVLIDNTPPAVTVLDPGPLSGEKTLEAQAGDPAPQSGEPSSGVASVSFEAREETATGSWITIGTSTHVVEASAQYPVPVEAYSRPFNTQVLANGSYELRATAEDHAGNKSFSAAIHGVPVSNGSSAPAVSASLSGIITPAQGVHFLGTATATAQHPAETWAYGFTSAPPAEVAGQRLEYTAEGQQLVLLRYTAAGGWQIAGVPEQEEAGGSEKAFKLLKHQEVEGVGSGNRVHVDGAMTPSGEAWLWLSEASQSGAETVGLFHRQAGAEKPFLYDASATATLRPLLGHGAKVSLTLGESPHGEYGMIVAPGQASEPVEEPAGSKELSSERVRYGELQGDSWTLQSASLPEALSRTEGPVTLSLGELNGPGEGWAAFQRSSDSEQQGQGLILGRLKAGAWTFPATGNHALDLSGPDADALGTVTPSALKVDGRAVWVEAEVRLPPEQERFDPVVALLEEGAGAGEGAGGGAGAGAGGQGALTVARSWCSLSGNPAIEWSSCEAPLGDAAVPDAVFTAAGRPVEGQAEVGGGGDEQVALALQKRGSGSSVAIFEHGEWRHALAAGYEEAGAANADFSSPDEGWLAGPSALGQWSSEAAAGRLASWPLPDRAPLTSVALTPGGSGAVEEAGALTVGFKGTALRYEPATGWQVQPLPAKDRRVNLLSVAFNGSDSAYAVGQYGTILHWNGSSFADDPQSTVVTGSQLNSVSFKEPSGEGPSEGWAVGSYGTILHYDGVKWSVEEPPAEDAGTNITSVAVTGSEAFAIAGGNLIVHHSGGGWEPASWAGGSEPAPESLRLAAALPDGGVVLAGSSTVLFRQAAGDPFEAAPQPLQGQAVALAPFREAGGRLRAYVSVAPGGGAGGGGLAGDGELMRESEQGWQDLSRSQYAGSGVEGDGAVKPDPVLALASGESGEHAWVVGGYDGTADAAGQGTEEPLSNRPETWQTASLWHYDVGGSVPAPETAPEPFSLPAAEDTVSFAFFTSPLCKEECSAVPDAQPDVNLSSAAQEISAYAGQGGGPAFAMLGGNAVGPVESTAYENGTDAVEDFAHLPQLLSPLGGLPTYAAPGPFDRVPKQAGGDELGPWARTFAGAPQPFGSGPAAAGISPAGPAGASEDEVHRYYAFNASQNGGTLRVIVLDDSAKGGLEPEQRTWLERQLEGAEAEGLPVVVVSGSPLRRTAAHQLESVAELLTEARWNGEVLAVFSPDGSVPRPFVPGELHEYDERRLIPEARVEGTQIPEYEGATLGYEQSANNGVTWYLAAVNVQTRTVTVSAVPVIESLTLKAVDGLSVTRSKTLQFEAIARRPASTLATKATESSSAFEGYDDYVQIPAQACRKGRKCIQPSYRFSSSNPSVGTFVEPDAEGSPYPKETASGHAIADAASGLFCGFNPGTTVVTITAGLLSYSETVTVGAGSLGLPCGLEPVQPKAAKPKTQTKKAEAANGAAAPPAAPPTALAGVNPVITAVPPVPAPVAAPTPTPVAPPLVEPIVPLVEQTPVTPAILPATTPPVEPIPPGSGGYAQSPSAAERREKARKHASQSAFVIRPAGTSGEDWFYGAVALTTLLALALTAGGIRRGSRTRPALAYDRARPDRPTVRATRR